MPEGAAPDAAKAAAAGGDVRVENLGGPIADAQVDGADDAGGDAGRAVAARGAHGGNAVDELGLADRAEGLGPVGPEHGAAFDEDGGDDVVSTGDVRADLVQEVALLHSAFAGVPEVVVRIADGEVGLERLLLDLVEPGLVPRLRGHGVPP